MNDNEAPPRERNSWGYGMCCIQCKKRKPLGGHRIVGHKLDGAAKRVCADCISVKRLERMVIA